MFFCIAFPLFSVESKDLFTCEDTLCATDWIGDGYCDKLCMIEGCNFDSAFSGKTKYERFLFSDCYKDCLCDKELLTNNKCDSECDKYECGWDLGDCGFCSSGCFKSDLTGSDCKETCNTIECLFNNNNCGWCNEGCYYEDLLSNICKEECQYGFCNFFNTNPCLVGLCSEGCTEVMIGDDKCDYECNNLECNFDYGDCYCSKDCKDASQECYINDPCDNKECGFKDGKCGYCASGCFENNLGDGICQDQCNNSDCNYDGGDCGCFPGCSFIYNSSLSRFIQIGESGNCSVNCLVPECHFGIDFCSDKDIVKMGVLNYVVHQDSSVLLNLSSCICSNDSIKEYLDGNNYCEEGNECSNEECFFCFGKANTTLTECLRNSFEKCLVCKSTMVDGNCQKTINQCPIGYGKKEELSKLFNNELWCLSDPMHYSTSYYKEIYVDSNINTSGNGTQDNPHNSLYTALINIYAAYTKIFILSQEIDFIEDESTSIFLSDKYDPLNSKKKHSAQELWIIGIYSEHVKTKVYWKNNLKLTPSSQKFYLKNLEFVGTFLLKKDCHSEFCSYCPNLSAQPSGYYMNDRFELIDESTFSVNYSATCSSYSSVNVLDFSKEVYIENVDFNGFRYQYNSFIRSSGVLSLINVNFYKMQAKVGGSVIFLYCKSSCIHTTFYYDRGEVIDIGAGYNDIENVATGSFIISLDIGFVRISNVEFLYNFMFVNKSNMSNSYLFYSRNHLGTISITDCKFNNNYANFLIYIDVSDLTYGDLRYESGISLSHSQQHFYISNIEVNSNYCSKGLIYYLMKNTLQNIKIKNLTIKNSVIGSEGMLSIVHLSVLKYSDINGEIKIIKNDKYSHKIYLPPVSLFLETILIENSYTGLNSIMITGYPTANLKDIKISNIKDGSITNLESIIQLFKNSNRYLSKIDLNYEQPDLNCKEMILIIESVSLKLDSIGLYKIYCSTESVTSGLILKMISSSIIINNLTVFDIEAPATSGIALTIKDSKSILISGLNIQNISNFDGSVVLFYACDSVIANSVYIKNTSTTNSGSFVISNTNYFTLTNFELKNLSSDKSDGACLNLLTKVSGSHFKIKSGTFTECKALNAKGGAIYINSISKKSETFLEMNEIQIKYSQASKGSAFYITEMVRLSTKTYSSINGMVISYCICDKGGIITDLHSYGTLRFEQLKMNNNQGLYAGIYVFYSSDSSLLEISNSIFIESYSINPLLYLKSDKLGDLVHLTNVIFNFVNGTGISIFNLRVVVDRLIMNNVEQPLLLDNYSELNATMFKITGSIFNSIYMKSGSVLFCTKCDFSTNKNSVLDLGDDCYFSIVNSSISSNILQSEHLILISSGLNVSSSLISSNITSNILSTGQIISLFSSEILIKDSFLILNKAISSDIHAIFLSGSVLNLINSRLQFETFASFGALLLASSGSKVLAKNSYFENSFSSSCIIYCNEANLNIINCTFSGNEGGDIYMEKGNLSIIDSIFENSVLIDYKFGVVVVFSNYLVEIKRSVFKNAFSFDNIEKVAYLHEGGSELLDVSLCTFIGISQHILGIYSQYAASVSITSSDFSDFNTETYSALTIISTLKECSLKNLKITRNNSEKNGGGVYLQNSNANIENSEISFNIAKESGGGFYFNTPTCTNCGLYITGNSKIFNNSALNGGAIKWEDFKPYIENKDLIFNNSAVYGAEFASIPTRLGFGPHMRGMSDIILGTLSDVPPGKIYTDSVKLDIYDLYEQIITTENSMLAILSINDSENSDFSIIGSTVFKAQNGTINITDFTLSGKPGSEMYLKLTSESLKNITVRNIETIYTEKYYLHVQFRYCANGEQIQPIACVDCSPGKYTLKASENCLNCPDGAVCTGRDKIITKNGFWRSSLESDVVYACEVYEACLGGNETSELGECAKGYSGVLCQSCIVGHSKNSSGKCTKCPDEFSNIVILVIICLIIIFVSSVLVKTTLTSAFSPKALHSIYIKIFTNYLQLLSILTQLNLEWPYYTIEFFKIQKIAATVTDQIFSIDCYLAQRSNYNSSEGYYIKLCLITGIPVFIIFISYIYWFGYTLVVMSYSTLKREVFTTIIVLFFLVYPSIVKLMFSNFSCVSIDKMESYLKENTEIQCWNSVHIKYSLIVAAPGIILWALGFPTLLLILMTKHKRRLHLDNYRVIFGFFYNGYKLQKFYWEIIIIYRKILLITILVFMASEAFILQALNVIIVLATSLFLQYSNRPYNSRELNYMEMQALCTATITIYSGLYYLSKSIGERVKVILFVAIILGNFYFIVYWVYYMIRAVIYMIIKIFPQLKAKYKGGDAFEEEFYTKKINMEGVYFNQLEGVKAYTFFGIVEKKPEKMEFKTMDDAYIAVAKKDIEDKSIK